MSGIQKMRAQLIRLGQLKGTSSLYFAARSLLGGLPNVEFGHVWRFFKDAEDAAQTIESMGIDELIDSRGVPLTLGTPELGDGLSQFRLKAIVTYDVPGSRRKGAVTIYGDLTGDESIDEIMEALKDETAKAIAGSPTIRIDDFDFKKNQAEIKFKWITRRF